jgi:general secretion pathway protein K
VGTRTNHRFTLGHWAARQHGAALLIAMVILTLISTLAAGMVWQQSRAIQVEAAERARVQSAWIVLGALDLGRLVLITDAASAPKNVDHLGEVWAVPLAESRLSTFLQAQSGSVTVADNDAEGLDAFLSGSIVDAQSRWNLFNLIKPDDGTIKDDELKVLQALAEAAGTSSDVPQRLAEALRGVLTPRNLPSTGNATQPVAVPPRRLRDLTWLGWDATTIAQLEPFVTILPKATPVNVNTASREVIAAVAKLSGGQAQALVEARQSQPLLALDDIKKLLGIANVPVGLSVNSEFFEVKGRLRLEDTVLEEVSVVHRRTESDVRTIQRWRVNGMDVSSFDRNRPLR